MQVLGDLIHLPHLTESIPLPWWHRAPLGLQTGTQCFVSITKAIARPVGDLVVSVLEPGQDIVGFECEQHDSPGLIANALRLLEGYNFELGESVTFNNGDLHSLKLICTSINGTSENLGGVKSALDASGFQNVSVSKLTRDNLTWTRTSTVDSGWIHGVQWRSALRHLFGPKLDDVDLTKAIVSADTTRRLLRLVFPSMHARTIRIEHRNQPGMLLRLTEIFSMCGINILSFLLRRGGARPGNNVLVAVCEPGPKAPGDVWAELSERLESFDHHCQVALRINAGLEAEHALAPKRRDAVVAPVPADLVTPVRRLLRTISSGITPIFLSRRLTSSPRAKLLADQVRTGLEESNGLVLEVSDEHQDASRFQTIAQDVATNLWVSQGGVAIVTDFPDNDIIGGNLPQEIGFLQGQAKHVLVLVQENQVAEFQARLSNLSGVWIKTFSADESALDPDTGVRSIVEFWMRSHFGATDL